jgi:hypothetical protein
MIVPRMKHPMSIVRRHLSAAYIVVVAVFSAVAAPLAFAQEEEITRDARLEGYESNVFVANDSTALTWLFFVLLGVLALIGFFKNAKRTHLD